MIASGRSTRPANGDDTLVTATSSPGNTSADEISERNVSVTWEGIDGGDSFPGDASAPSFEMGGAWHRHHHQGGVECMWDKDGPEDQLALVGHNVAICRH